MVKKVGVDTFIGENAEMPTGVLPAYFGPARTRKTIPFKFNGL